MPSLKMGASGFSVGLRARTRVGLEGNPRQTRKTLKIIQRQLATVFTHPRGVRAGLAAAGFHADRRPITMLVADRPPVPLHTRLAVYSDAYFLRLSEVLSQDFAAVRRALGERDFLFLTADYLLAHPSQSPLINDLGRALPAFLKIHPLRRRFPFLPDLAALEWTALQCLFGDRPSAPLKEAGPHTRLRLANSARLLRLRWPVHRLWERRSAPAKTVLRRLTTPQPTFLWVFRNAEWVQVRAISSSEHQFLTRLAKGQPLSQTLRGLNHRLTPAALQSLLENTADVWVEQKMIHCSNSA